MNGDHPELSAEGQDYTDGRVKCRKPVEEAGDRNVLLYPVWLATPFYELLHASCAAACENGQ